MKKENHKRDLSFVVTFHLTRCGCGAILVGIGFKHARLPATLSAKVSQIHDV